MLDYIWFKIILISKNFFNKKKTANIIKLYLQIDWKNNNLNYFYFFWKIFTNKQIKKNSNNKKINIKFLRKKIAGNLLIICYQKIKINYFIDIFFFFKR